MIRQLTTFCSIALLSSSLAFAQSGSTPTKPAAPNAAPSTQGTQKSTTSKSTKKHRTHHKKAATPAGATTATKPASK